MRSVYAVGTTIYSPADCANGYTLVWHGFEVILLDMNGRDVRRWHVDDTLRDGVSKTEARVDRARLLPNGRILVQRGGMMSDDGLLQEWEWDGSCAWEFMPEGVIPHGELLGPHHDVNTCANGNRLTICRYAVPDEATAQIRTPQWRNHRIWGDAIIEVSPGGEVVWTWYSHAHLDLDHYRIIASPRWPPGEHNSTVCDWTHVNTVQGLPENRWYDAGDERFRPGNVLISPRNLDTVYLIDHRSGEVVWQYAGNYFGGLSGQHEPHMIEPGLQGEGNILIFDNGASPWKDLGHAGASYVLEIEPPTGEVVWVYDRWLSFYSTYTSNCQRLAKGNTLICESSAKRVFEVTQKGELVWEYVDPQGTPRAYRYPYDHCPQTAALDRPAEKEVIPPLELRVQTR